MRVSINIDDGDGPGIDSETAVVLEPPLAVAPDPSAPPADLAARAEALGALSAGPAPGPEQVPSASGAPAITPPAGNQPPTALGGPNGFGATEDLAAGAAPGQPDPSQSVGDEQ